MLAGIGCGKQSAPNGVIVLHPPSETPPAQNSPDGALRLLEWSYVRKDLAHYRRPFTADFRFIFSDMDSNGAAYRDIPWTRDDELISAAHLFNGGDADQPAATDIRITLDHNFNVIPDNRPGRNPDWHVTITTQVLLHVQLSDGHADDITGSAKFFLTRGDSALIPDDLGASSDPNVWYIDRWEDFTAPGSGGMSKESDFPIRVASPSGIESAGAATWGRLKAVYR